MMMMMLMMQVMKYIQEHEFEQHERHMMKTIESLPGSVHELIDHIWRTPILAQTMPLLVFSLHASSKILPDALGPLTTCNYRVMPLAGVPYLSGEVLPGIMSYFIWGCPVFSKTWEPWGISVPEVKSSTLWWPSFWQMNCQESRCNPSSPSMPFEQKYRFFYVLTSPKCKKKATHTHTQMYDIMRINCVILISYMCKEVHIIERIWAFHCGVNSLLNTELLWFLHWGFFMTL